MSLKGLLSPAISSWWLSEARQRRQRGRVERARRARGEPHRIDYFHQPDDPYSALAAAALPALARRYEIALVAHVVGPPDDAAAPERDRLAAWSRLDASRLARRHGLRFEDPGRAPSPAALAVATHRLLEASASGRFVDAAADTTLEAWAAPADGTAPPGPPGDAAAHLAASATRRARLGHYLGATFHYGGEWYWGIDRLHHLERRLQALGAARAGVEGVLFEPDLEDDRDGGTTGAGAGEGVADRHDRDDPGAPGHGGPSREARSPADAPVLDFWFSLRSPYTAIAAPRVIRLARRHGATLRLRGLLPMVMRGLPVPPAKRRYIATDAAREARLHGVPFGRIVDPVGRPAERGLAVMAHALRAGRGEAFLLSFLQGAWAEGVDAGAERGLRGLCERAGLDWGDCRAALADDAWRADAERHRTALFERGLWGVPSLAVGDVAAWGQDRLWVAREALRRTSPETGGRR